jgi:hypothetical protein
MSMQDSAADYASTKKEENRRFKRFSSSVINLRPGHHRKTRVMCQTASSLVIYHHWAWRGRHRKHSLIYYYLLFRVYGTVVWQCVDEIRYISIVAGVRNAFII